MGNGEVAPEHATVVTGQDLGKEEKFRFGKRAVQVSFHERVACESLVEVRKEDLSQEVIAIEGIANSCQTEFLHEPVLKGLEQALHTSFGLWGMGMDHLTVKLSHRALELSEGIAIAFCFL